MKKLFVVVLTGGPCGGKSSSLRSVRDTLRGRGYNVMTMPEVPTILMSNGANFPGICLIDFYFLIHKHREILIDFSRKAILRRTFIRVYFATT